MLTLHKLNAIIRFQLRRIAEKCVGTKYFATYIIFISLSIPSKYPRASWVYANIICYLQEWDTHTEQQNITRIRTLFSKYVHELLLSGPSDTADLYYFSPPKVHSVFWTYYCKLKNRVVGNYFIIGRISNWILHFLFALRALELYSTSIVGTTIKNWGRGTMV